jgi:membrane-associated phospholipid phosphatase
MKAFVFLLSLLPVLAWAQGPLPGSGPASLAATQNFRTSLIAHPPGEDRAYYPADIMLVSDSLPPAPDRPKRYQLRQLALPLTLITLGFAGSGRKPFITYNEEIHEEIREHFGTFKTHIDNYTRNVPIATVYALNLAGIKGRHDLYNLTALFLLSDFFNSTATSRLKKLTHQLRPDQSSYDSFPSGHTSGAFTQATVLYLEFKDQSIWYGVGGYSLATATGGLRMLNKKHWLSDVLAGAGVGILSTRLAYMVYPWIQKKISQGIPGATGQQWLIMPGYAFNTPGITLLYTVK